MVTTRSKSKKLDVTSSSTMNQVKDATPKKLRVSSSSSHVTKDTTPSRELVKIPIPMDLYDSIKDAAFTRATLGTQKNDEYKLILDDKDETVNLRAMYYKAFNVLPSSWEYNHETALDTHVPIPPASPKKKIKRTIRRLPTINGTAWTEEEQKVWNNFIRMNIKVKEHQSISFPKEKYLILVEETDPVVDLIVGFAVEAFNDSYHKYVKEHRSKNITQAVPLECKYYKLTSKYCFYVTIDAIEQGKPGVYEAVVECDRGDGARKLCLFALKNEEGEKSFHQELEYEKAWSSDESDPEDFYEISGMVHRRRTRGGGFNYHNPSSLYRYLYGGRKYHGGKVPDSQHRFREQQRSQ